MICFYILYLHLYCSAQNRHTRWFSKNKTTHYRMQWKKQINRYLQAKQHADREVEVSVLSALLKSPPSSFPGGSHCPRRSIWGGINPVTGINFCPQKGSMAASCLPDLHSCFKYLFKHNFQNWYYVNNMELIKLVKQPLIYTAVCR